MAGKILGCPKCGSMVLVEPPADFVPEEQQSEALARVDAEASSGEGSHAVDQVEASVPGDLAATSRSVWTPLVGAAVVVAAISAVGWYAWWRPHSISKPAGNVATVVSSDDSATDSESERRDTAERDNGGTFDLEVPEESSWEDSEETTLLAEEIDPFEEAEPVDEVPAELVVDDPESQIPPASEQLTLESEPVLDVRLSQLAALMGDSSSNGATIAAESPAQKVVTTTAQQALNAPRLSLVATQEKLAQILPNAQFQRVPLVDFLHSVSQLADLPIALEPEALQVSGQSVTSEVTLSMQNSSILEVLTSAIEPLGLLPRLAAGIVVITSDRLNDSRHLNRRFAVGDLLVEGFDCVTFVSTLVDPSSWSQDGGGSIYLEDEHLVVDNAWPAIVRVAIFLEQLRRIRGLPLGKKMPGYLIQTEPRWIGIARRLKQPIDICVWQESTFQQVLSDIEQAIGMRILVDWNSVLPYGVHPHVSANLYARDLSAREAISRLLEQVGILDEVRFDPLANDTLYLSLKPDRPFLQFYQFEHLDNAQKRGVEDLMLRGKAAIDPVSGIAIVRGPSALHRLLSSTP